MNKYVLLASTLLLIFGSLPVSAQRVGIPVVVMAEDSDPNSVPRSSDIFYRVIGETQELMSRYDFLVLDEQFMAGKLEWRVVDRRPREELVDFVSTACTTGDATLCPRAMVLLKIRASAKSTSFGTKARVRMTGDVYDGANNSQIGGWEPVTREFPAPRDCPAFCLEEVIGDNARELAISLADVLRKKLAYLVRGGTDESRARPGGDLASTIYKVNFRYFTQDEVLEMKETMELDFPCFEQVRGASGDFINYTYNYVSCAPNDKIHEWLSIMLTDMGFIASDFKITTSNQREIRVEKLVESGPPPRKGSRRFN